MASVRLSAACVPDVFPIISQALSNSARAFGDPLRVFCQFDELDCGFVYHKVSFAVGSTKSCMITSRSFSRSASAGSNVKHAFLDKWFLLSTATDQ